MVEMEKADMTDHIWMEKSTHYPIKIIEKDHHCKKEGNASSGKNGLIWRTCQK